MRSFNAGAAVSALVKRSIRCHRQLSTSGTDKQKTQQQLGKYTHGHASAVVQNHATRTCEDFALHVVRLLRPADSILDVGCGPGSITKGFRKYVGPAGKIVGIDLAESVLEEAKRTVGDDAEITYGDVYKLQYPNQSFDVVHAHQVLQHLQEPVKALQEMKRVSKGIVACREVDYESWLWHPHDKAMQRWKDCYRAVCRKNKAEPDAGKKVKSWFLAAGFNPSALAITSSTVMYADPDRTKFISESWSKRVGETQLGEQMVKYGFASRAEVDEMAKAWLDWGKQPDAVMFYVDVAVVGRV